MTFRRCRAPLLSSRGSIASNGCGYVPPCCKTQGSVVFGYFNPPLLTRWSFARCAREDPMATKLKAAGSSRAKMIRCLRHCRDDLPPCCKTQGSVVFGYFNPPLLTRWSFARCAREDPVATKLKACWIEPSQNDQMSETLPRRSEPVRRCREAPAFFKTTVV